MTKNEFKQAFALAESGADLSMASIDAFYGFGSRQFETVWVTIQQVARLIRWQAQYLSGGWDSDALTEVAQAGRRKFQIVNEVAPGVLLRGQPL